MSLSSASRLPALPSPVPHFLSYLPKPYCFYHHYQSFLPALSIDFILNLSSTSFPITDQLTASNHGQTAQPPVPLNCILQTLFHTFHPYILLIIYVPNNNANSGVSRTSVVFHVNPVKTSRVTGRCTGFLRHWRNV